MSEAGSQSEPSNAQYLLLGADRRPYRRATPGQLGGNLRGKLYCRLDCPSALRALAAGYRPWAVCLPDTYRKWKNA